MGPNTWRRYWVDHEIYVGLKREKPVALLGLVLPNRQDYRSVARFEKLYPRRLHANLKRGFAVVADWTDDPKLVENYARAALRGSKKKPDNRLETLKKNIKKPVVDSNGRVIPNGIARLGEHMPSKKTKARRVNKELTRRKRHIRENVPLQNAEVQKILANTSTSAAVAAKHGVNESEVKGWVEREVGKLGF